MPARTSDSCRKHFAAKQLGIYRLEASAVTISAAENKMTMFPLESTRFTGT